jgi:hypothetical protein
MFLYYILIRGDSLAICPIQKLFSVSLDQDLYLCSPNSDDARPRTQPLYGWWPVLAGPSNRPMKIQALSP